MSDKSDADRAEAAAKRAEQAARQAEKAAERVSEKFDHAEESGTIVGGGSSSDTGQAPGEVRDAARGDEGEKPGQFKP